MMCLQRQMTHRSNAQPISRNNNNTSKKKWQSLCAERKMWLWLELPCGWDTPDSRCTSWNHILDTLVDYSSTHNQPHWLWIRIQRRKPKLRASERTNEQRMTNEITTTNGDDSLTNLCLFGWRAPSFHQLFWIFHQSQCRLGEIPWWPY